MDINKQVTLGEKKYFLRKGFVLVRVAQINYERRVLSRRKVGGSSKDNERSMRCRFKSLFGVKIGKIIKTDLSM